MLPLSHVSLVIDNTGEKIEKLAKITIKIVVIMISNVIHYLMILI